MSRSRLLAVVVAFVAAALGLTLAPSPTQADSPAVARVTAKVPTPPKVGTCRNYGDAGYVATSETSRTVPCGKPHTARVIKVGHFVNGTTWKTIKSAANITNLERTCIPAYKTIVGGTNAKRDQSAYAFDWFAPTRKQFRAGARWFRCDIVLPGRARLLKLPKASGPFLKGATLTTNTRRCADSRTGAYYSCATPHDFRSVGTFRKSGKAFPTRKAFLKAASNHCPAIVGSDGWYAIWPVRVAWNKGDHVVVCLARD